MSTKPDAPTDTAGERQPGPFTDTETTTYKISAFEITIVKDRKSSHVPPLEPDPDCECDDSGPSLADILAAAKMATSTRTES